MSLASSLPCHKLPSHTSSSSSSSNSSSSPSSSSSSSYKFITIRSSNAEEPLRRPSAPSLRQPPSPTLKPASSPSPPSPSPSKPASSVVEQSNSVVTVELQRKWLRSFKITFVKRSLGKLVKVPSLGSLRKMRFPMEEFVMKNQFGIKKMSKNDQKLVVRSFDESKKTWHIAGPAILTGLAQFSIGFVTVAFVGHLGNAELAAVSIVQIVIDGLACGVMLGMGSALETLCGQAVGAGQVDMLGIYLQRSWIICGFTALILTPIYIFASPILKLLHQSNDVSEIAGKYAAMVIPQLFAYAMNFPMQKYLQSQSRVWVMTMISVVTLPFHIFLNWVLITKLQHGIVGAAIAGNISFWLLILAQMFYITSGYFPDTWTGFSTLAFNSLTGFLKLSLASAIMLCLEYWYYTAIILLVGFLKHSEIELDAVSICMNLQIWALNIALGFNAAVSVRVSNELGGGHPKVAKFSIVVNVSTSILFGIVFSTAIIALGSHFPKLFTDKPIVIGETSSLAYFLAASILLNSIQPVLLGVAVGAGWQFQVAFINIACYYLFGLPFSALLGYKFKLGIKGIWSGMLAGCMLQTVILLFICYRTNWNNEVVQAEERIRSLGGSSGSQQNNCEELAETQKK